MAKEEAAIQKKIQDYIQGIGGYVIKTIATNRAGVPDILACIQGQFIAIEVKTSTGHLSELQKIHLQMIQKAGGIAFVARDILDVKEHLVRHGLLKE